MRLRNTIGISCLVLIFGLVTGPAQSQVQDEPPVAQQAVERTGCLSKSGDTFRLLDHDTGASFGLMGGTDLEQHVGHTVTVSGTRTNAGDGPETLRVQSVKHIAAACEEPTTSSAGGADGAKPQAPTADDQGMSERDQEITREIRKAVVHDETLSMDAHNVKIITQSGMVTLRGPVRSEAEKRSIETKAKTVAGDARVKNDLTVTNDSENSSSNKGDR